MTSIELTGLLLVVVVGLAAIADGGGSIDAGQALDLTEDEGIVAAIMGGAGLAFFALIGFEDSVNMAEELRDPRRDYPRALFGGLRIAGAVYLCEHRGQLVERRPRGGVVRQHAPIAADRSRDRPVEADAGRLSGG